MAHTQAHTDLVRAGMHARLKSLSIVSYLSGLQKKLSFAPHSRLQAPVPLFVMRYQTRVRACRARVCCVFKVGAVLVFHMLVCFRCIFSHGSRQPTYTTYPPSMWYGPSKPEGKPFSRTQNRQGSAASPHQSSTPGMNLRRRRESCMRDR